MRAHIIVNGALSYYHIIPVDVHCSYLYSYLCAWVCACSACVGVRIHVCVRVYLSLCVCVCVFVNVYVCECIYIFLFVLISSSVCVCALRVLEGMCVCSNINVYTFLCWLMRARAGMHDQFRYSEGANVIPTGQKCQLGVSCWQHRISRCWGWRGKGGARQGEKEEKLEGMSGRGKGEKEEWEGKRDQEKEGGGKRGGWRWEQKGKWRNWKKSLICKLDGRRERGQWEGRGRREVAGKRRKRQRRWRRVIYFEIYM